MGFTLLPADFDALVSGAIRSFWDSRAGASTEKSQGGTRDVVVGGKNMDGFINLVRIVARHSGLPDATVFTGRGGAVLPGYFRGTKNWDVVIVHHRRLVAVFEFKSQVGSFGNNFNNRSEEVIGAAADLWVAHHHGAYQDDRPPSPDLMLASDSAIPLLHPDLQRDPRPPFLGWLMLLEDCPASTSPVRCDEPHYRVFPEFRGASYARRYQILCERLMERQLYSATSLVLSGSAAGSAVGAHRALSDATSVRNLFAEFAGRALSANS